MFICADDYGLNESVNQAILALVRQKKIQGVSVLIVKAVDLSVVQLKELKPHVQIGLHLDLFESIYQYRQQIRKQLNLFTERFGFFPDFLDGHKHCHIYPFALSALITELKASDLTEHFFIRSLNISPALSKNIDLTNYIYLQWLNILNKRLISETKKNRLRTNRFTWGVFNSHCRPETAYNLAAVENHPNDLIFFHPGLKNENDGVNRKLEYDYLSKI